MPLKGLSFREVQRKLLKAGFYPIHQKGSHVKFVKDESQVVRTVIVPHKVKDIPLGTVLSIVKQSGLSKDEFDAL